MERIENYFETKPEIYKVYTLQEMYSFLGRVSIKAISLTESEILQFDDNFCMKNIYNTEDYPFCIEGNMRLRINPDYYLKNTDKMKCVFILSVLCLYRQFAKKENYPLITN